MSLQQSINYILPWWCLNYFSLFIYVGENRNIYLYSSVLLSYSLCHQYKTFNGLCDIWNFAFEKFGFPNSKGRVICVRHWEMNRALKVPFLWIECNGNLDAAQRRTSALQTSKCGQMDTTLAVMRSVEIQLILCKRSWSHVLKQKANLCCAFCSQHDSGTKKREQNRSNQKKEEAQWVPLKLELPGYE